MKSSKLVLVCLLVAAVLVVAALSASARPFPPGFQTVTQANGATDTITMQGSDEVVQLGKTVDGYSVMFDAATGNYVYAVKDAKGNLVASNVVATDPAGRSVAEKVFLAKLAKGLGFSATQLAAKEAKRFGAKSRKGVGPMAKQRGSGNNLYIYGFPSIGQNLKHLVICVDYTDLAWIRNMTEMTNYFNQQGYQGPIEDQRKGSFRDWYYDCSYHQLLIDTTVKGPYHLANNRAYYTDSPSNPAGCGLLVLEAIEYAYNDGVNFSPFDNDQNGWVDTIGVVFAGYSKQGGDPYGSYEIMGSLYCWYQNPVTYNGKKVCAFYLIAELRYGSGSVPESISAAVHEFGHGMWLWDYPLCCWSEMDYGPWAGGWGDIPTDMDAYCKDKLNWSTPVVLSSSGTGKTLHSVDTANEYFKIPTLSGAGEYFLLENRQQNASSWDRFLPGHGMLIYHIQGETDDPNLQPYTWMERGNNDPNQYPGWYDMSSPPGTPFPGTSNTTAISDNNTEANMNLRDLNNAKAGIAISNIAENSGVITFNFTKTAPPNTDQFCASATVDTGTLKSGTHSNTHASDNSYMTVTAVKVATKYTVQETFTYETGITTGLAYLYVTTEAGLTTNNLTQEVYLYKPSNSTWVKIGESNLTTADSTAGYLVAGPNNYVTAGGQIKVLLKIVGVGTKYDHKIDLLKLATQAK